MYKKRFLLNLNLVQKVMATRVLKGQNIKNFRFNIWCINGIDILHAATIFQFSQNQGENKDQNLSLGWVRTLALKSFDFQMWGIWCKALSQDKTSSSSIISLSLLLQFLLLFSSYVGCKVFLNFALNYLGLAHAKIVRWQACMGV